MKSHEYDSLWVWCACVSESCLKWECVGVLSLQISQLEKSWTPPCTKMSLSRVHWGKREGATLTLINLTVTVHTQTFSVLHWRGLNIFAQMWTFKTSTITNYKSLGFKMDSDLDQRTEAMSRITIDWLMVSSKWFPEEKTIICLFWRADSSCMYLIISSVSIHKPFSRCQLCSDTKAEGPSVSLTVRQIHTHTHTHHFHWLPA